MSNFYKQKLKEYVRSDNKNRFRFFVLMRERSCMFSITPEDVLSFHDKDNPRMYRLEARNIFLERLI